MRTGAIVGIVWVSCAIALGGIGGRSAHAGGGEPGRLVQCAPTPADTSIARAIPQLSKNLDKIVPPKKDDFPITPFDSLYYAKMTRVEVAGSKNSRSEFALNYKSIAYGASNPFDPEAFFFAQSISPFNAKANGMSSEQIQAKIDKWSKSPQVQGNAERQLQFLSFYGSLLAQNYDESMKNSTGAAVIAGAGGQCTEIHAALGLAAQKLKLGIVSTPVTGVNWGTGNDTRGHGVVMHQLADGRYVLQNYGELIEMDAKTQAQALEMATSYLGPFSGSLVVGSAGKMRAFKPRTYEWAENALLTGAKASRQSLDARVAQGQSGQYEVTIKPFNSDVTIGAFKSGEFELQYVGFTGSGTKVMQGGRETLDGRYAAVLTHQVAPDLRGFGGQAIQNRQGVSFLGQLDYRRVVAGGPTSRSQVEAGGRISAIGVRPHPDYGATGGYNADFYVGLSNQMSRKGRTLTSGVYEQFNLVPTASGVEKGNNLSPKEMLNVDARTVFKVDYKVDRKDGYERYIGNVVLPSLSDAGQAVGVYVGIEQKRGNLTLSGEAGQFFSNEKDPYYNERRIAMAATALYTSPIGGSKSGQSLGFGYQVSSGYFHPQLGRPVGGSAPGVPGGNGLFVSYQAKLGRNPQDANKPDRDGNIKTTSSIHRVGTSESATVVFNVNTGTTRYERREMEQEGEGEAGWKSRVEFQKDGGYKKVKFERRDGYKVEVDYNGDGSIKRYQYMERDDRNRWRWKKVSGGDGAPLDQIPAEALSKVPKGSTR